MNRRPSTSTRKVRMVLIGLGLTAALALTGTGVHAGWTAHTSTATTATTATTAFTSAPGGTATVSTLGESFAAANAPSTPKTLSFHNSGTAPLNLRTVNVTQISSTGGLSSAEFMMRMWPKVGTSCAASPPETASALPLAAGAHAISGSVREAALLPGQTASFCASTVFTGTMSTLRTADVRLEFTAGVGDNWTQADSAAAAQRTFTHTVQAVAPQAPTSPACASGPSYRIFLINYRTVNVSWTASTTPGVQYRVYYDPAGSAPAHLIGTTSNTTFNVEAGRDSSPLPSPSAGNGTILIRSVLNGIESPTSVSTDIRITQGAFDLLGMHVDCR